MVQKIFQGILEEKKIKKVWFFLRIHLLNTFNHAIIQHLDLDTLTPVDKSIYWKILNSQSIIQCIWNIFISQIFIEYKFYSKKNYFIKNLLHFLLFNSEENTTQWQWFIRKSTRIVCKYLIMNEVSCLISEHNLIFQ